MWPLAAVALVSAVSCSDSESISPISTGSGGAGGATATGAGGTGGFGASGGTGGATTGGGGQGGTGGLLGADCDPLVPTQCGFPFPSNVYTVADSSTDTGLRVAFGKGTLPLFKGKHIDPSIVGDSDGFSPGQAPMTHFPGATITGLPQQTDIDRSLDPDSPTVLMEADTGVLVPHFAELDMSTSDDSDRAFFIRPVVRLKDKTRYLVAIRNVVDAGGMPLAPSPAFAKLRDAEASKDPAIENRRGLYDDIFARLEAGGVPKDDLQIAWDYTTASRDNNVRRLLHMRDDALAIVGDQGPAYAIDMVEEDPNPYIKRRITGHMTVPLYLDKPGPGGKLMLDAAGLPKQNGTADYSFLVHVPNAATAGTPLAIVQNGHGLLGSKSEGQDGYLAQFADEKGYVAVAVDMVGMAAEDEATVIAAITQDPLIFRPFVDRQLQGMLNSLLAMRMMKGRFVQEPEVQFNGASAIDPTHCYYRGDSQGGIFGTTYMALSTDVTRGLLGEPGTPYNLLLNRSEDFAEFFGLLKIEYPSAKEMQIVLGLVQMLWDRSEPDGYLPYINGAPLPNTPSHQVLIHAAIGDYQVTPLGAHIIARGVGARNTAPLNRDLFWIDYATPPYTGSGITEFSFGLPESPLTNIPPSGPDDDDPHDKVRVLAAAMGQSDVFFRTGVITTTCDGVCDPE